MAFNRTALSNLSLEDERYLNQQLSPQSRPMELFPTTKASDPLPGNWSYDSAIDLFSLNPADMDPVSFDFADMTSADSKDLFMDPFGTPTAISGFSMPTAEDTVSLSSDLDSDDQSWSMSARPSIDMTMTSPTTTSNKPITRASTSTSNTSTSKSTRWSSSPEIKPQEYNPPRTDKRRKTRSLSDESTTSSSGQAPASAPQDPQGRNAAKRAAHNIIEKRYRTNMNAKFLALEKAISPAGVQKSSRAGAGSLKKSEILSNALAYIERIQQENLAVQKELALLKQGIVPGGMWRSSKQGRS
ncbi:uncharacterized protein N7496_005472 [Penicillium cataractarum]|uniref:BHLH domain-containing protein n=1 Tax=Penicillium cataractarum TaxID=2100454 RepID=A0A9W9SGA6_9EURO|nr:uncharacterized protein N7496_005472 [Penicillium cataractarum]KAJ5378063.1 hypothetical protein N7496_005472 [Penicillium cataractarum]